MEESPDPKFTLKSKTVQANVLMAIAVELFPAVKAWIGAHPSTALQCAAFVNILMRHVSDEALSIVPKRFR